MNKSELIDAMTDASGLSKADAGKSVDAFVSVVTDALRNGDSVALVGFGTFQVKDRAERKGRNPRTGEEIKIRVAVKPTPTISKKQWTVNTESMTNEEREAFYKRV